jgi:single-strand DNA-binding protein
MSVNKFIGIGFLGQNAESRQVGQSTVIKFSIAMTERYKDSQGQVQERTEWADIEYWGGTGILPYLVTGQQVYIEGSLRTDKWQDQQSGQWRSATKIRAKTIQLLGSPRQQNQNQQNYAPQQGYRQQRQANYAQPQQQYAQQPAYAPQQQARPRPAPRPQAPQQPQQQYAQPQPQQAYDQPQPEPEQLFDGQDGQPEGGDDLPF